MEKREEFGSRWGLLLVVLGMAVGTGNIWRFPRIIATNHGGSFLIPWVIFLFLWALPLLIIEFAMGKESRRGTIGAFGHIMGRKFGWMGGYIGFCATAITFYYSVVTGWCLKYLVAALLGQLNFTDGNPYWNQFINSQYQPLIFHFFALLIGGYIIYKGVVKGIERVNKYLVPSLFILLIIAAIRSVTLPGAIDGLNFLFKIKLSDLLDYQIWLQGLTQAAWSTGAGWGLLLTYGVYVKKKEDITMNSVIACFGDYSASLLAGIAVICIVFALRPTDAMELIQQPGPANTGLSFIWFPALFNQIVFGRIFQIIFFLALLFAALSSLIAQIELATRNIMDIGLTRKNAILIVGIAAFVCGIPSALFMDFFINQDWVWGLGLIVSGMFVALAAIRYGIVKFRDKLVNTEGSDIIIGNWFDIIAKYIIPLEFVILIIWWFSVAIQGNPETWWNPFNPASVGTCIIQWGLVFVAFILLNNWLMKRNFDLGEK